MDQSQTNGMDEEQTDLEPRQPVACSYCEAAWANWCMQIAVHREEGKWHGLILLIVSGATQKTKTNRNQLSRQRAADFDERNGRK